MPVPAVSGNMAKTRGQAGFKRPAVSPGCASCRACSFHAAQDNRHAAGDAQMHGVAAQKVVVEQIVASHTYSVQLIEQAGITDGF